MHVHAHLRTRPTWIKVWAYSPNKHTLTWTLLFLYCSGELVTPGGNCWGHRKPTAKHRFSRCINEPLTERWALYTTEPIPRAVDGQPSVGGCWSPETGFERSRRWSLRRFWFCSDAASGETPVLVLHFRSKTSTEAVLYKHRKNKSNSKRGGNVVTLQHNQNHVCGFMKLDSPIMMEY